MSELSSDANPQILVNGKQEPQQDAAAAAEEQMSSVSLDEEGVEDGVAAEKETQAKMQSAFQQVRDRIRSQGAQKSSILELVQRVRDRGLENTQVNGEPEGKDVSTEEKKQAEVLTDASKDDVDLKEERAFLEKKLEASKKALRDEFEVQLSQVRAEMQAYTDRALKDLESKMQSQKLHSLQPEVKGADKKPKPAAAPTLASRRGRVLTRTMTTIIPKTCAPVIVGPRAKSETLTYKKGESSLLLLRDPVPSLPGGRKPLLPPHAACPPLHQRKRPVRAKAKAGN